MLSLTAKRSAQTLTSGRQSRRSSATDALINLTQPPSGGFFAPAVFLYPCSFSMLLQVLGAPASSHPSPPSHVAWMGWAKNLHILFKHRVDHLLNMVFNSSHAAAKSQREHAAPPDPHGGIEARGGGSRGRNTSGKRRDRDSGIDLQQSHASGSRLERTRCNDPSQEGSQISSWRQASYRAKDGAAAHRVLWVWRALNAAIKPSNTPPLARGAKPQRLHIEGSGLFP